MRKAAQHYYQRYASIIKYYLILVPIAISKKTTVSVGENVG